MPAYNKQIILTAQLKNKSAQQHPQEEELQKVQGLGLITIRQTGNLLILVVVKESPSQSDDNPSKIYPSCSQKD